MIPIKLIIEGVYSYQGRHSIDFEKLVNAGLFGVFGTVGSGKSSILEALTFALYGETERLNSRGDNRNYNMMNLRSNSSLFDFEFYNYKNEKYKIRRSYSRNSRKFEDVSQKDATLYQAINNEWIPLDHVDVERIIGLGYKNFKRTIIIPQGRFREFIDLPPTQRTEMLKEIFGLHRFDLGLKVRELYTKTKSELDRLIGQLENFEEVNADQVKSMSEEIHNNEGTLNKLTNDQIVLEQQLQALTILLKDIESLAEKETEFAKKELKKDQFEQLRKEVNEFEKVDKLFKQSIHRLTEKNNRRIHDRATLQKEEKALSLLKAKENEINSNFNHWFQKYDNLEHEQKKRSELEHAVSHRKRAEEIEVYKLRVEKGEQTIKSKKQEVIKVEESIKTGQLRRETLYKRRIDPNEIIEVASWYQNWNKNNSELIEVQKKVQSLKSEHQEILQFFDENVPSIDNWAIYIKSSLDKDTQSLRDLQNEEQKLLVQSKLGEYAHSLAKDCPCPLCGSTTHPQKLATGDISALLSEVKKQIENTHQSQQKWWDLNQKCLAQSDTLQRINKEIRTLLSQEEKYFEVKDTLIKSFKWEQYSRESSALFEHKKQETELIEKELKDIDKQLSIDHRSLQKYHTELDKYSSGLQDIKIKLKQLEALSLSEIEKITLLSWEDLNNHTIEGLQVLLEAQDKELVETQHNYNKSLKEKHEWEKNFDSQQQTVRIYLSQLAAIEIEIEKEEQDLNQTILQHGFKSKQAVESILSKELNVLEIRKTIEEFTIAHQSLSQQIQSLKIRLQGHTFDPTDYKQKEDKLLTLKKSIKELTETNAKLVSEVDRLGKQLLLKKDLLDQRQKLEYKLENISTISTLMRSNGFVNYASSVWLGNLVTLANHRFHRMTKNQLSLKLNSNNEFEVIDYLNEGKSRSVKTLSGGQIFQVSLSLALALAESVQSLSSAQRNFFFIDEGFGTQDTDSANIIFETLDSLRKENRIVGIISHVESLQERIPASLYITKSTEKGSTIHFDLPS